MKSLPTQDEMYRAMLTRDTSFDGVFYAGVRTTGVFCRPGCGAKKPRRENVEYFGTVSAAMHAGYRACRRCRPLDPGGTAPAWATRLIELVEREPTARISAAALRSRGVDPARAARYFKSRYGVTFQGYQRARRMGIALREIRSAGRRRGMVAKTADRAGFASESGFRGAFTKVFGSAPSRIAAGAPAEVLVARWLETPVGPMLIAASEAGVCLVEFVDRRALATQIGVLRRRVGSVVVPGTNEHLDRLEKDLKRYFAGESAQFTAPLVAPGTEFQAKVWEALQRIPAGTTRSYAAIAREIGRPSAVRAVARANGDNRIAIIIPCHRVIGSDGSMTGYGGGVWRKEWLLDHERKMTGGKGRAAGLFES